LAGAAVQLPPPQRSRFAYLLAVGERQALHLMALASACFGRCDLPTIAVL